MSVIDRIEEMVHREAQAWDERDVDLLLSTFHPDLVWVWPADGEAGDLTATKLQVSRFDPDRWHQGWSRIFSNELLVNRRRVLSVTPSPEGDSGVAIVDVETFWRTPQGQAGWRGRATKCYVRVGDGWKLMTQIGL
jgi:ketosteroid isomerase-like protein